MGFTPDEFRKALGMYPTGVTVVSGKTADGEALGMTVNSFASVSLKPPLISFNLANSMRSLEAFRSLTTFAVNLLREDQTEVSRWFAKSGADKWADTGHRSGEMASPILQPNFAVFECEPYAFHEAGDHVIVVGRVLHFETSEGVAPLVFFRGSYCGVVPSPRRIVEPTLNRETTDAERWGELSQIPQGWA
ncbi:MAG: flavin reductase family protein [Rhodospirillales bacterium]|nr:flavin reductase family protein [Rhodospirillales bacterium]MDP6772646.1 flavin reductase family protein [Rhodospirillales bacterium]